VLSRLSCVKSGIAYLLPHRRERASACARLLTHSPRPSRRAAARPTRAAVYFSWLWIRSAASWTVVIFSAPARRRKSDARRVSTPRFCSQPGAQRGRHTFLVQGDLELLLQSHHDLHCRARRRQHATSKQHDRGMTEAERALKGYRRRQPGPEPTTQPAVAWPPWRGAASAQRRHTAGLVSPRRGLAALVAGLRSRPHAPRAASDASPDAPRRLCDAAQRRQRQPFALRRAVCGLGHAEGLITGSRRCGLCVAPCGSALRSRARLRTCVQGVGAQVHELGGGGHLAKANGIKCFS